MTLPLTGHLPLSAPLFDILVHCRSVYVGQLRLLKCSIHATCVVDWRCLTRLRRSGEPRAGEPLAISKRAGAVYTKTLYMNYLREVSGWMKNPL